MGASKNYTANSNTMSVGDYSDMQNIFTDGGSVNFWIFARSLGSGTSAGRIFQKNISTGSVCTMIHMLDSSGNKIRIFQSWGTPSTATSIDNPINFNEWINLSINYNKNNILNKADFYINGSLVPSTRTGSTSGFAPRSDAGAPLGLGNNEDLNSAFDGLICYAQLFNRILTQPEIKEIMHKPGSIRNGLVGFWPMTDDGSTQRNLSGIGNTGAVTGPTNSADGPPVTCFK